MPAIGITDGPPPCAHDHGAVVLSCSHLTRSWAALERHSAWLFVNTQVKAFSRETDILAGYLKYTETRPFNNTHTRHCHQDTGHAPLIITPHTVALHCRSGHD